MFRFAQYFNKINLNMKKLFTIAAISIFAVSSYAQEEKVGGYKPCEGTVATEVSLSGGLNTTDFQLNTSGVKFRYFLKEDLALRLGLNVGNTKNELVTGVDPNLLTTTVKASDFAVTLGVEKHFVGSDRLSTYAGADLVIGSASTNTDAINQNGNYSKTSGGAGTKFGVRLLTGADYYIAKKVFLGVEAGISFLSGKDKDGVLETKTGNVVVTTTTTGAKRFNIATAVFGGVRLGYQF